MWFLPTKDTRTFRGASGSTGKRAPAPFRNALGNMATPGSGASSQARLGLRRFEEAKSVLRKMIPVARRFLGESNEHTLKMSWNYAAALYNDEGATLDDLREAVTTLEDTARTVRRVFGGEHTSTKGTESGLRNARAVLRARETPSLG